MSYYVFEESLIGLTKERLMGIRLLYLTTEDTESTEIFSITCSCVLESATEAA